MLHKGFLACLLMGLTNNVSAEWSSNIALMSDYLFNGVSQTQKDPALQLGIDWYNDDGLYAGAWGSNVDFGDQTDVEIDVYGGYAFSLTEDIGLDVGIAYYSYHGAGYSDEGNYPEIYIKTNYQNWQFNVWYTNDYFGTDAAHVITMLNYSLSIDDTKSVTFGVDRSTSLDSELYEWSENEDDYIHWQVVFDWQLEDYSLTLGLHDTDLDWNAGSMLVAGISASF